MADSITRFHSRVAPGWARDPQRNVDQGQIKGARPRCPKNQTLESQHPFLHHQTMQNYGVSSLVGGVTPGAHFSDVFYMNHDGELVPISSTRTMRAMY